MNSKASRQFQSDSSAESGPNKYIGSNFDDFLREEDLIDEVSTDAHRRVIEWQSAD